MSDDIRRNMPLFSMSIVGQLTGLSARQVRYYEEHQLVYPARTEGNRRLFSFNDIDRLLEIKSLIDKGVNLAGIKQVFAINDKQEKPEPQEVVKNDLSHEQVMKFLKKELIHAGKLGKASLIQGELSRFFQ